MKILLTAASSGPLAARTVPVGTTSLNQSIVKCPLRMIPAWSPGAQCLLGIFIWTTHCHSILTVLTLSSLSSTLASLCVTCTQLSVRCQHPTLPFLISLPHPHSDSSL